MILNKHFASYNPLLPLDKQLNSLDFFKVVLEVEKHFNVQLHTLDFDPANFLTAATIAELIHQRLRNK